MSHRLNIVFFVPGMPFDGETLNKHSLGGSETAGLCMAREMAALGHKVTMFCNAERQGKFDDVDYLHINIFKQYISRARIDVLIAQRLPELYSIPMQNKLNILWLHDLGLKRYRQTFRSVLWNVDEVWGLSDFHINQMMEIYQTPRELYWKTRNGIDDIMKPKSVVRKKKRLIYTARPERGMEILLTKIMPEIWKRDPEVELVMSGYDNTVEEMRPFYERLERIGAEHRSKGYKVNHIGHLNKTQLYKAYQEATLYVYPTEFEEISCITAMETMACGLPMVATKVAALPETLDKKACSMIEGTDIYSNEKLQIEFVNEVLHLLKPENEIPILNRMRKHGTERSKELKWSSLAKEWSNHFIELFELRTLNKESLAKHFYRYEDIMALKHMFYGEESDWNTKINKEYAFVWDDKKCKAVYEAQEKDYCKNIDIDKLEPQGSLRLDVVLGLMNKPGTILDYGGGIGNEAVQFANKFDCNVHIVNLVKEQNEIGEKFAAKCKKNVNSVISFYQRNTPDEFKRGKYDTVFCGELLEHLPNPSEYVDRLEEKCRVGGQMIFTVPAGAWGDTDKKLAQRGHLWNFEYNDLHEMFGKKKDISIKIVGGGMNETCREPVGWHVISYTKTDIKTDTVNLDRKCAIQAPRQTISACMIIGGEQSGLLHRCLTSIYDVVDEILISDTGMTEKTLQIATHASYAPKITIIPNAPDPNEVGFDEARNFALNKATCDWILWIDSDEELLTPARIYKYLRYNYYQGYSIRQHHFSAQPPEAFKADMPVRLFKNHNKIKFFGVVHEHPETEINKGVGETTVLCDVDIAHDGYLTEEGRRKRFDRNYDLLVRDREKYPDRLLGKFLMMRDWMHLSRYTLEHTRNQLTPDVIEWCEKTIKCYQDDFLEGVQMMSDDGLSFYSEACTILNKGLEYSFNFAAAPNNVHLNGNEVKARFARKEDFEKFINHKIKHLTEPYEGRYV